MFKVGLALFDKRRHPFFLVVCRKHGVEYPTLETHTFRQADLEFTTHVFIAPYLSAQLLAHLNRVIFLGVISRAHKVKYKNKSFPFIVDSLLQSPLELRP